MEHIYIFDYTAGKIYHTTINENEDFSDICEKHNLKEDDCFYMTTSEKQEIEELD